MPQSRTGAAGHGMLEIEMETQRDSGGYSGSLLCMKSLTVYHLQDKAQQSRSQTEAVQHTHTHFHTYVCRQAGRQATCGTETEIYADMKTSPMASVKRNIRRQRRRRRQRCPQKFKWPAADWRSTSQQAHPGTLPRSKLVVIQCSNRNLMELTFVSHHSAGLLP